VSDLPRDLDHTFTAPIGVEVKGKTWTCVAMPDSASLFGTKNSVRVDATVDDLPMTDVGLMATGRGGYMLSLSKSIRRRLGKDLGDEVTVHLQRRLR
jgi:hypothetical protein